MLRSTFLLGQMNPGFSSFFNGASNRYFRSRDFGVYAQDNFKLRRNLAVNVGLCFDWQGPLTEKNGLLANFYADRYKYDPATDMILDGGIVIAGNNPTLGTSGVSDSTMKARQWGFGPRFGIVWSPSFVKNIVVRAGFGLYYDRGEFFSEFSPGFGRGSTGGPFGVTLALPFTAQIAPLPRVLSPIPSARRCRHPRATLRRSQSCSRTSRISRNARAPSYSAVMIPTTYCRTRRTGRSTCNGSPGTVGC